jgi:uncharacterized protein (TIGR02145 family)
MKAKTFLLLICISAFCDIHAQTKDTFEDYRDGKVYKTIQIGSQTWMAENLAFKADTGCWAYNNDENHVAKYGRLYTYETAMKVCPPGWHLPTKEEFETLIRYAGTNGTRAYKELIPTGITGFDGVFGGFYRTKFQYIGQIGHFWSSTEINKGSAFYFGITSLVPDAGICIVDRVKNSNNKTWGFSIRCVKD